MQIRQLGSLVIMICCISLAVPALGANTVKIGIVDFQKILKSSEAGKEATADIEAKGKAMETELKNQGSELQDAKDRLDREALVMSQDKRSEKERELRIRAMDFQDKQKRYSKEFNDLKMKLVNELQKKVLALAGEIGKKEGYLLILEKNTCGALYFPASIDLTDQLIKMYDKDYAKDQAKNKKSQSTKGQ
jgi:outer membrane protein